MTINKQLVKKWSIRIKSLINRFILADSNFWVYQGHIDTHIINLDNGSLKIAVSKNANI